LATLTGAACSEATVTNSNTTTTNATTNINSSNSANMTATTTTTGAGTVIESKEPDKYSATMTLSAATSGQQAQAVKTEIKVARNGSDRRYSIDTKIPTVGEIIFLDKADKRYLILPARKQYAELTPELTGFDVGRSMTPGQLVAYVSRQQGVTLVGEETLNNRPAIKYRLAGKTQTSTTAGEVAGETFIYVDKETGLPLRVEGFGQSSGNVQGMSGGRAVLETRDLKTDVNAADFELPQGFRQITPEQLKQQTAQLMQFVQGIMGLINAQAQAGAAATPSATPTASPTR
jgi:hypothetical protein